MPDKEEKPKTEEPKKTTEMPYKIGIFATIENAVSNICGMIADFFYNRMFPLSLIAAPFILCSGIATMVLKLTDKYIGDIMSVATGGLFGGGGKGLIGRLMQMGQGGLAGPTGGGGGLFNLLRRATGAP